MAADRRALRLPAACLAFAAFAGLFACDKAFSGLKNQVPGDQDLTEEEAEEPYLLDIEPDRGYQGTTLRIEAALKALPEEVLEAFNAETTYITDLDLGGQILRSVGEVDILRPQDGGKAGLTAKIIIPPNARTDLHRFKAEFMVSSLGMTVKGEGQFRVVAARPTGK